MSEQLHNPEPQDEISLKDIIDFLLESWKTIVLTGLLGTVGSTVYLWATPNQYQAIAQIQMAQISDKSTHSLRNVEPPNLLMARLQLPTTYLSQEVKACGLEDEEFPLEALATIAKFSVVRGVESLIELKIQSDSKEGAIACAQSLFERIKTSQNAIMNPFIEEAKDLLIKHQDRLKNLQSLISRADKSGAALSAVYLASRDEVNFLSEEVLRLTTLVASVDKNQAKLISPIYASDIPIIPNKRISLIAGLFGGLFIGLLMMIGKRAMASYRASYNTVNPSS